MSNSGRTAFAQGFVCPNCGSEDRMEIIGYPADNIIELNCPECYDLWEEEVGE